MSFINGLSKWGAGHSSNMMSSGMRTSSSGMVAEKFRMDVISANIANAQSSAPEGTEPYKRRIVNLVGGTTGPIITNLSYDESPFRVENEPGNPNADASGNVHYSNVEPLYEAMDMMNASRSYELNVAAFNAAKRMTQKALDIGKDA